MRRVILLTFLVMLTGSLTGCFKHYVYVDRMLPVIEHPRRPTLDTVSNEELAPVAPETREKLGRRDAKLKDCIERYEDVVERYNEWARDRNRVSGYGDDEVEVLKGGD